MTPLCFIDTETDGVHPDRKVWEVAIIRRDDAGEQRLHLLVEIDLATADPFGLKIGRFYERHPLGRWVAHPGGDSLWDDITPPVASSLRMNSIQPMYADRRTAAGLVARWTHGAHVVGAVPNFDTEVLAGLLREKGLTPAWHYHLIDVENVARGWLLGRGATVNFTATSSDDLSRQCGVEPPGDDERHTAMGDAEWCMRWWDQLTTTGPQG